MTTNLFVIANVKQLSTWVVLEFYCLFFRTSWSVGVLNSAIFNSFHIRVEFGTILEGLRNFGGGGVWTPPPPPRYATANLDDSKAEMCGTPGWHQLGKNISGLHMLWLKMVGWQQKPSVNALQETIQNIHPKTTGVLICDGHNSNIGVGLFEKARKQNIVILKLPPCCQCSLFSNKIPIIWNFCIYRWLAIPINLDQWRTERGLGCSNPPPPEIP